MTTSPAGILSRITARRRERLAQETDAAPRSPGPPAKETPPTDAGNRLLESLRAARGRAIIAEVKMGSPRIGSLADRVDPARQARAYADAGAAALSVVVEPDFFFGSYELLERCREASGLPALAKDFIVSPRQLDWAKEAGADAVLLIASLYTAAELSSYAARAGRRGLVPLVECHDAADVAKLGDGEWPLVGVNNRDLRTFEVNLERSIGLVPSLPAAALKIAESGIRRGAEVRRLAAAGFDGFLIGEALLLADDPAALLEELIG